MDHISLFELNKLIDETLSKNLETSYWVIAEIGQMQVNQKGHCYLELIEKEDDVIKAKIRGTIWSYTYRNLSVWFEKMTGQRLKQGIRILFNATIQFHEVYGLSLNIKDIDANFTLGERARRRSEIIEKLKTDGVFEMNQSLELPIAPQGIAIISSPTAAGYEDFIHQLENNPYGYRFFKKLFAASMQGDKAPQSIIQALHLINNNVEDYDLVIIIRGGGASTDLDCFDDYELASHVAQFPLPVITGIGHDRDETITDLVAHTKLKTPTAVSEFLISGLVYFEENLLSKQERIREIHSYAILEHQQILESAAHAIHTNTIKTISAKHNQLNLWQSSIIHYLKSTIKSQHDRLESYEQLVKNKPSKILTSALELLNSYQKIAHANEQSKILSRGFTISRINGKLISQCNADELEGKNLETKSSDFQITSTISKVKK